jgi:hypothetical protein
MLLGHRFSSDKMTDISAYEQQMNPCTDIISLRKHPTNALMHVNTNSFALLHSALNAPSSVNTDTLRKVNSQQNTCPDTKPLKTKPISFM